MPEAHPPPCLRQVASGDWRKGGKKRVGTGETDRAKGKPVQNFEKLRLEILHCRDPELTLINATLQGKLRAKKQRGTQIRALNEQGCS